MSVPPLAYAAEVQDPPGRGLSSRSAEQRGALALQVRQVGRAIGVERVAMWSRLAPRA